MESKPGAPPPKNGHAVAFFMSVLSHSFVPCTELVVLSAPGRFLHMPFCDSIVGLARDNTAHLFNEKNLGCACSWPRVSTAAALGAQTTSADTCASFLFGQTKRNRDTL
jgi:hypothetical protein